MTDQIESPSTKPPPNEKPSFVQRTRFSPAAFAVLCLLAIFILYQVVGGTLTFFIAGTKVTAENVMTHRVLTILGQLFFVLVPTLVFARLLDRRFSAVFPWRMPRLGETIFASLGLIFLQEVFQIYLFFQDRVPLPEDFRKLIDPIKQMIEEMFRTLLSAQSGPELLFVVFVVAVAPAIIEELLFRGLVQGSLERALTPARAALITGIIFGAFHFNPFEVVPLMGLGWYFSFLRMRSRSMVLPMTTHFLNNVLAVIVVYFHMDDEIVIGASGGADVNLPAIFVQLFLFIGLFVVSFTSYLRATGDVQKEREE
jgi:hypothetical protein